MPCQMPCQPGAHVVSMMQQQMCMPDGTQLTRMTQMTAIQAPPPGGCPSFNRQPPWPCTEYRHAEQSSYCCICEKYISNYAEHMGGWYHNHRVIHCYDNPEHYFRHVLSLFRHLAEARADFPTSKPEWMSKR